MSTGGHRAGQPDERGLEPRVSVVIPAYNEGDSIVPVLDRLFEAVTLPVEVVVVVDFVEDTTVAVVEKYAHARPNLRWVLNSYGRGPANAIRYGIDQARAGVTVVTMSDGSDDPQQIDELTRLVERGVVIAAASRYMPGGQQVGGPLLKGLMSRAAGRSLYAFARVGTRDATNSFKAYSTAFVRRVGIDSRAGFEIGLELTAKARRLRLPVAEVPTIWLDRALGASNFQLRKWLPEYLKWYRYAFGHTLADPTPSEPGTPSGVGRPEPPDQYAEPGDPHHPEPGASHHSETGERHV